MIRYLLNPDSRLLGIGNLVYFSVCLCGGVLLGSTVSVYTIAGIIFGSYHLLRGTYILKANSSVTAVGLAFFAYFCTNVLTTAVHFGGYWMGELVSTAIFLGFVPLISLVRAKNQDILTALEISAAIVPIIATPSAIDMIYQGYIRIELAAGNAGVTAVLASVLYLINLVAIFRGKSHYFLLSYVGVFTSFLILIFTGMRALLPVIVILPIFLFWYYHRRQNFDYSNKQISRAMVIVFVFAIVAYPTVSERLYASFTDLQEISKGDTNSSLGQRAELWQAGWALFLESPLFGHGPGNVGSVMTQKTAELTGHALGYSHFHNAIISELVRSGLVGFLALTMIFWIPIREIRNCSNQKGASEGFVLLAGTHIIYFASGVTGIMINHDLLDSTLLTMTVLCVYLSCVSSDDRETCSAA